MKIIDLLNIKWNNNELPRNIKCNDIYFKLDNGWYYDSDFNIIDNVFLISNSLNYEIEIIEEPKKI